MTGTTRSFLTAVLLVVLCCPALGKGPRGKKTASDVERLQGTWLADLEPGLQGRLVLDGSHLLYVQINEQQERIIWDGHFAVNEQADPKQMDWTPLRRNNRNPPSNLAVYRLQGDLLLIVGSTEGPRPEAFYSGGGEYRPKTIIFRRLHERTDRNARRSSLVDTAASE